MPADPSPVPVVSRKAEAGADAWATLAHHALRSHGHRIGPAREQVISAIARGGPTTAKDLADRLTAGPGRIAVSSVYRSLAALVEVEALRTVELAGVVHYEAAGLTEGGGRYLLCRHCGRTEKFASPEADAAIAAVAGTLGYDVWDDDIVVHGRCAACTPAAGRDDDGAGLGPAQLP